MIARQPSASRATDADPPRGMLAAVDATLSSIAAEVDGLVEELGELRAGASPLVERLAATDAWLAEQRQTLAELAAERAEAVERAALASAALQQMQDELRERDRRTTTEGREVEELRDTLRRRQLELVDAQRELALMADTLALRDATLASSRATIAELEARAVPVAATDTLTRDSDESVIGHVRFAASPTGYRLVESGDSCSSPGDLLDVEGARFVVVRVGRSPLPGDARPCAFLEPIAAGS